ncbi:hypothetical protein ACWCQL_16225, partial [Streptomyces sp. NPDC002073]
MALAETQWDLVTTWAQDYLLDNQFPREPIKQYFGEEFAANFPYRNTPAENAKELVYRSRASFAGERLLLEVLSRQDRLTVRQPEGGQLQAFLADLAQNEHLHLAGGDPFLTTVLRSGSDVFIDRADLRRRLKEFTEDPEKTVFVVDGDPGTGRSYTFHLIRHIAQHSRFTPARVKLDNTMTAASVMRVLNSFVPYPHQNRRPASPDPDNASLNPARLNDALPSLNEDVHDLVGRATDASDTYWFILDECDKLDATSDVWDCIGKLALAIFEHSSGPGHVAPRLVLLGYSATMRQLPYEIRKNECRDVARPAGPDDLRTFFGQFFAQTPDPLAPDPGPDAVTGPPASDRIAALVEQAASAVLTAAGNGAPDTYMLRVCAATEAALRIYHALGHGQDFAALLAAELPAAASEAERESVSELRRAYREAACLLTRFDPTYLRRTGEERSHGLATSALVDDCMTLGSGQSATLWALKPQIREQTLRGLAGPDAARRILEFQEPWLPEGAGVERTALDLLSGRPLVLEGRNREELATAMQAVLWLSLIPGVTGLPDVERIQQLRERARLLEPLERLVQGAFRGRTAELDQLRLYVGLPAESGPDGALHTRQDFVRAATSGPAPPLLIHGMGGIGKSTLLAKFLVNSLRDFRPGFPFAYIDFERPTLSVHEPSTMIAEIARQFGMQYPAHRQAFDALAKECEETAAAHRAGESQVDDLNRLSTTRATLGRQSSAGLHAAAIERDQGLVRRIGALVAEAVGVSPELPGPPLVIALDSFEEAQYRGSLMLGRMWAIWSALQEVYPRLRFIVSGRAPVSHPARAAELRTIELGELDLQASVEILIADGVKDPETARQLAARVGGHPLSLKLAALAAVAEGAGTGTSPSELLSILPGQVRSLNRAVDRLRIQGVLYGRILHHISDPQVRELARAGLGLRTITPDLVKEVLAGPAGLTVESDAEARRLFGLLARLDMVEPAGQGALRHRPDLRPVTLGLADKDRIDVMRAVGENAVAYYAAREGPEARAEEIYHRLRLNQNPRTVEDRWIPGVERFLSGADADMDARAAAFLTARLGGHTPDQVMAEARLEDWEQIAAREVTDLLAQGFVDAAASRLSERRPWTAGSELHPLLVETLARQGLRAQARAEAEAAIDRAEREGFPDIQLELLLLAGRLAEEDGDLVAADRSLAEAEDIATHLGRGFEAMGALLARSRLAAASPAGDPAVEARLAERLENTSDDALSSRPALARAVAAEVSRQDPHALEHTIQVVGLPSGDDQVLDALAAAIGKAVREQPQLAKALLDIVESSVRPPQAPAAPASGGPPDGRAPRPSAETPSPPSAEAPYG